MKLPFRPRWLLLLLLIPLSFGLARLRFNAEILDLLPSDLPAVEGLKLYQRHFANTRELVISLDSPDPVHTESAAASLASNLTASTVLQASVVWQPPWQEHPDQAAELIAFAWLNQPHDSWNTLTNRLHPPNLDPWLQQVRHRLATSLSPSEIARAAFDPFQLTSIPSSSASALPNFNGGHELFASPDGTFRVLFVQAPHSLNNYRACVLWLRELRNVVATWQRSNPIASDVSIAYTGQPAFMAEIGGGMERDMMRSVSGTTLVIALLFYAVHRRFLPLLWLLLLLAIILAATLTLGTLLLGTLNVLSVGFAAILLGLAADYGLVLYQESRAQPHLSPQRLRRLLTPSILWAAITTSAAFLALTLSQLPGIAQLGTLVTIGILFASALMLLAFLPPLLPSESPPPKLPRIFSRGLRPKLRTPRATPWILSCSLLVIVTFTLLHRFPQLDHSPDALRPRHSAAYAALEQIKSRMSRSSEPLWLLISGPDERTVAAHLEQAARSLDNAVRTGAIEGYTLPTALWPRPDLHAANHPTISILLDNQPLLRDALTAHGFTDQAAALTDQIFNTWRRALQAPVPFLPTSTSSRWLLDKFLAYTPSGPFALGLIHPSSTDPSLQSILPSPPHNNNVSLTSWTLLGHAVLERIQSELRWLSILMLLLLVTALSLAFRSPIEVLLSLAAIAFSLLCLLAIMSVANWSWNLMNLMALPLFLGTAVDYGIHIQLALRRHNGHLHTVHRGTGRALLLCGATTFTGFASLAWSSNAGLASLGRVCATGIACATLTAVFLLPSWWRLATRHRPTPPATPSTQPDPLPTKPSRLYRSDLWRAALFLSRLIPPSLLTFLAQNAATAFRLCRPARHRVVVANLLPVLNNDLARAHTAARSLFRQFGAKLADLWRLESGRPVDHLFGNLEGAGPFFQALQSKRGVLLVTPHLGNWEFGAPLLTKHGVSLLALTMEEPHPPLTNIRSASRARRGIETIVVRRDPFAFLEIIRRLEQGATVALLIDRPPPPTAVQTELFGLPLDVSIAPAELARASGCIVLPVTILRKGNVYTACVLPEIPYDRPALRNPEARLLFTSQIMRAFEPAIRQHPDQWFHFVPIWPRTDPPSP
jgi:uncharacterized protein